MIDVATLLQCRGEEMPLHGAPERRGLLSHDFPALSLGKSSLSPLPLTALGTYKHLSASPGLISEEDISLSSPIATKKFRGTTTSVCLVGIQPIRVYPSAPQPIAISWIQLCRSDPHIRGFTRYMAELSIVLAQ